MTEGGNQGGGSDEETSTFIYGYLKSQTKNFYNSSLDYLFTKDQVDQLDLVPTLSYILGIPIPFCNLGSLIHELMIQEGKQEQEIFQIEFSVLSQIMKYLNEIQTQNQYFDQEICADWMNQY